MGKIKLEIIVEDTVTNKVFTVPGYFYTEKILAWWQSLERPSTQTCFIYEGYATSLEAVVEYERLNTMKGLEELLVAEVHTYQEIVEMFPAQELNILYREIEKLEVLAEDDPDLEDRQKKIRNSYDAVVDSLNIVRTGFGLGEI